MEGRVLRPLGVGEALDAAFNLYFRNFGLMLRITLAVVLPVTIASIILVLIGVQETTASNPDGRLQEIGAGEFRLVDQSTFVITTIIAGVLSFLAYLLAIAAIFRAASERYVGRPASAAESLRAGLRRTHSILWISLLIGVTFILIFLPAVAAPILALLFAVPLLVFLFVRWSTAIPALMVEGKKGSKALGRSYELVEGRWGATFGVLIVAVLFIFLLEFLVGLALEGLGSLAEEQTALFVIVVSVMNGLGTLLTAPFQAAVVTVIYYDLRVRKEAFDVELMTQQLDSPGAAGPPPPPPVPAGEPGSTPPPPPPATPSGW